VTLQARTDTTIAQLLASLDAHVTKADQATLMRLLPRLLPPLLGASDPAVPLSEQEVADAIATTPAQRLLECLDDANKGWAPWLLDLLPGFEARSYRVDYRRAFSRCMRHGCASGLITMARKGVSPSWQEARGLLVAALPHSKSKLAALRATGVTEIHGLSLARKNDQATVHYFNNLINNVNRFGRHMSRLGIEHPSQVQPAHFKGGPDSFFEYVVQRNPQAATGYYQALTGWRVLSALRPDWKLALPPTEKQERRYGVSPDDTPRPLRELLEDLGALKAIAPSTVAIARQHLCGLLGYFQREHALDLRLVCKNLAPEEVAWLLMGGYPELGDGEVPSAPADEIKRFLNDSDYLDAVLARLRIDNGKPLSRCACRENPFVALYVEWQVGRERASMAEAAAKGFSAVLNHYLRVNPQQLGWLRSVRNRAAKAGKRQAPSSQAQRKVAVSGHVDLWPTLVAHRNRLTAETEALYKKMRVAEADESLAPTKRLNPRTLWARAVRDELAFGILLALAIRKENVRTLRIGASIIPSEYRIQVPQHRSKNGQPIIKFLPESGPFADLRGLLDLYVRDARPILLGDRGPTDYLFVTLPNGARDVRDERGMLMPGNSFVPVLLERACREHFADLLPEGVDTVNAHLVRHLLATHLHAANAGQAIAAQWLNHSVAVTQQHYIQLDRLSDERPREMLNQLEVKAGGGRKSPAAARKKLAKDLAETFGVAVDSPEVNRALLVIDRARG
jgi:integrase